MLIAALSYSVMGLSVHALGEDSWSMALLARALFGLPFAFYGVRGLDLAKEHVFEKACWYEVHWQFLFSHSFIIHCK